jgi:tRNA-Thr(GGU) m(6)t(6)A37 methyltransferase TsaA
MASEERMVLKPIGFVRTRARGDEVKDKTAIAEVVIRDELAEALEGIADFSHLYVLFWLNEVSSQERKMMKIHPRGREDLPLLGVFATRTKFRPNPIGLTLVELIKAKDNVLTVRGLDAFDGTPVLDIKPFDYWDIAKNARMPNWWIKLEKEKMQKT